MKYALKDIRIKKNISQQELADAANISVRTLQRYEDGNPPNVDIAIRLAAHLQVSTEVVFQHTK